MLVDQQLLLFVLILLFGLVIVLMVFIGVLVYKLPKRPPEPKKNSDGPEPPPQTKKDQYIDPTLMMCVNHPERQAQGVCAISQEAICEACIREDEGLIISVDHFRTYLEAQWVVLDKVRATPEDTSASAHIYRLKKKLWSTKEIPTLVSTHYKIDVDTDQIESHIHFLVREQERDDLQTQLDEERQNEANLS